MVASPSTPSRISERLKSSPNDAAQRPRAPQHAKLPSANIMGDNHQPAASVKLVPVQADLFFSARNGDKTPASIGSTPRCGRVQVL